MTNFTHNSHADVTIERPQRYAKQLASHISHKVQVDNFDGGGYLAHIGEGLGHIMPSGSRLTLVAEANDDETLERIQSVLGKHLLQFTPEFPEVMIEWVR